LSPKKANTPAPYPSHILPERILVREARLGEIEAVLNSRQVYLFQSAPGQGKSVFAIQMAEKFYSQFLWYDVTKADQDPIRFCTSLHTKLSANFPKYKCPEFESILKSGKLAPLQYETYVKDIIKSLKKITKNRIVLIFDNADLLPDIGLSCKALRVAISMSSQYIHFIITTRKVCQIAPPGSKMDSLTFVAGNSFFTLTKQEFQSLAVVYLKNYADFTGIDKIFQLTEGWIKGVVTTLNYIETHSKIPQINDIIKQLDYYFTNLCALLDDKKAFSTLTMLSLLSDIKIDFSIKYHGGTDIAKFLVNMLDNNLFIYRANSIGFRLHNLFAHWLSRKCTENHNKFEIELFLNQAADFELEKNNLNKAIKYLIRSKTYSKLELLIKDNIDYFLTTDNNTEMCEILSEIPPTILSSSYWMPLAYTFTIKNSSPEKTGKMFENILKNFEKQNNKIGIMLCHSGLIDFHYFVDGNSIPSIGYFNSIKSSLKDMRSEMTPSKLLVVYTSLAICYMYLEEGNDAKGTLDNALTIATELNSTSQISIIYYLLSLYYEMKLAPKMVTKYLNLMLTNVNQAKSNSFRFLYTVMRICQEYNNKGFSKAQESLSTKIRQKARLYIDVNQVFRTRLDIIDADNYLVNSDFKNARKHLEACSSYELDSLPPALSSILYGYKAILAAIEFDETALEYIRSANKLVHESGLTNYYVSAFAFYSGVTYTFLGSFKEAEVNLQKALVLAHETSYDSISAASCAYLSYLYHNIGNKEQAAEYASTSIKYLKKNDKHQFKCATREIMQNVFTYSYKDNSTSDYTKTIAFTFFDTAFSSEQELIPVMNINAFGEMKISIGSTPLPTDTLSGNFRMMLAILISSSDYSAHQEVIQSYMWPSSNKEHARKSFDNLMSRFRKLLAEGFAGINPKDYITINNGIVKLTNVKSNADTFINLCTHAWSHYEKGEYTDTLQHLFEAKDLYTDRYLPFVVDVEKIDAKRQYADQAFIDLITLINRINVYLPDIISLDIIFSKWLDIYIHETDMVKVAYRYYKKKNNIVKCFAILKQYTEFLNNEGFSNDEIDHLIFTLKSHN